MCFSDKYPVDKSPANPSIQNDGLNNRTFVSKSERALKELREEALRSNCPRAKGRTKRLFRALPDPLATEMLSERAGSSKRTIGL